jgi:hypothetical protein
MNSTATETLIPTGTWVVDPAHSTVGFSVKHLGIATVRGSFEKFEGTLEVGDDLAQARAYGTAQVDSINTTSTFARRTSSAPSPTLSFASSPRPFGRSMRRPSTSRATSP